METSDAVVVGAGVVGCATAFWLARAGLTVTVLERDALGQHASSAPAGALAPLDAGTAGPLVEAGFESLDVLREIEDELEEVSETELRIGDSGWVRLGDAEVRDARFAEGSELSRYGCRWMDRAELDALRPGFDPRWVGGLWSPREACVETSRLTRAFAAGALHYGARFCWTTPAVGLAMSHGCVGGVLTAGDTLFAAGDVVICAGAWTPEVANWLGAALPIEAESGEMIALPPGEPALPYAVSGPGLALLPGESDLWVRPDGTDPAAAGSALAAGARALLPALAEQPIDTWVGSSARTPDGLPLIGRIPGVEGASVASGHGRHGVLLAAFTAAGLVELLVEGNVSEEMEPFSPERFGP